MCQRLNTGESNNFYFGIFICIGPLIQESRDNVRGDLLHAPCPGREFLSPGG